MEKSYKEKYEDILTRLERAKNDDEVCDERFCCVIDDLIPELAESKNEKIRREIINYFQCQSEEEPTRKEIHNKWIAWLENIPYTIDHEKREGFHLGYKACLEKQGEKHPEPYNGISFEYNGHTWGMCARDNGVDISCDKHLIKHLEKQGEQKPADSYCKENCKGYQETGKCFADGECKAKREAEQKPVIEFKTAEESLGISSDEYNKIVDECLFGEQKLTEFERGLFDMLTDISKPCTADCVKSHSEKLLSIARKMIALEQKPADKIEPKFKVGDKIYLKPEYRMPDDDTPIANTVKEIRRIDDKHYRFDGSYIFIEDQDKYELVEQKPEENNGNLGGISPNSAWSEEDEDYLFLLNSICKDAEEKYRNSPDVLVRKEIANARNWLKSLKGRVKPQWKPSSEQIDLLQAIINEPKNAASESCQIVLREVLEQLKKLKEE